MRALSAASLRCIGTPSVSKLKIIKAGFIFTVIPEVISFFRCEKMCEIHGLFHHQGRARHSRNQSTKDVFTTMVTKVSKEYNPNFVLVLPSR